MCRKKSGNGNCIVSYGIAPQPEKLKGLRLSQYLFVIDRPVLYKPAGIIRLELAQHVPDSGQEHLADSDDSLFVSPVGFDSVIHLFEFRMLFGLGEGIGNLDQKRFQIGTGSGDAPGFHPAVALVVAWAATSPGDKMLR